MSRLVLLLAMLLSCEVPVFTFDGPPGSGGAGEAGSGGEAGSP